MKPNVHPNRLFVKHFSQKSWAGECARVLQSQAEAILRQQKICAIMLTGGRSAARLYAAWAQDPGFQHLFGVAFYFGDERCVPPDHTDSNYGMALSSLFAMGVPRGCSVFRMAADDPDRESAAWRYGELLPDKIDIMLLGVGNDGHIASMFPWSESLRETRRKVIPVTGPKPPHERLTITPPVIAQTKSIFVLASGADKALILVKALQVPGDVDALPVRLVLNATWLLDTPLIGESR